MTICVCFHLSGYRTFKWYYTKLIQKEYHKFFPSLVSYNRFVELMSYAALPLSLFVQCISSKTSCTGIRFDMVAEKDPYIESAYKQLQIISQDKQKRLEYEAREKAMRDYNQSMFEAEQRGGEERSRQEEAIMIAKSLLSLNIPEETIIKISISLLNKQPRAQTFLLKSPVLINTFSSAKHSGFSQRNCLRQWCPSVQKLKD